MSEIKHRVILGIGVRDLTDEEADQIRGFIAEHWPDVDVIVHGGVGTVVLPGPDDTRALPAGGFTP